MRDSRSPILLFVILLCAIVLGAWIARAQAPPGPPVSVNGDISDIPVAREGWTVVDVEDPLIDAPQVTGGDMGVIRSFPLGRSQPTGFNFDRFVMTYSMVAGQLFWGLHVTHPILYGAGAGKTTCAWDGDADGDPRYNGNSMVEWWMKDDVLWPGLSIGEWYSLYLRNRRTQERVKLLAQFQGGAVPNGWTVIVIGAPAAQLLVRPIPEFPPLPGYTDFEMGWYNVAECFPNWQADDMFDFVLVTATSREVGGSYGTEDRWSDHPGYQ